MKGKRGERIEYLWATPSNCLLMVSDGHLKAADLECALVAEADKGLAGHILKAF